MKTYRIMSLISFAVMFIYGIKILVTLYEYNYSVFGSRDNTFDSTFLITILAVIAALSYGCIVAVTIKNMKKDDEIQPDISAHKRTALSSVYMWGVSILLLALISEENLGVVLSEFLKEGYAYVITGFYGALRVDFLVVSIVLLVIEFISFMVLKDEMQ